MVSYEYESLSLILISALEANCPFSFYFLMSTTFLVLFLISAREAYCPFSKEKELVRYVADDLIVDLELESLELHSCCEAKGFRLVYILIYVYLCLSDCSSFVLRCTGQPRSGTWTGSATC